jgi:chromosome segregation ATPase
MAEEGAPAAKRTRADGSRLSSLEEETKRADEKLARLESASREMKEDVELLADATGSLRQQSAKMREAALRVAEVVQVAAERRKRKGAPAKGHSGARPPRT